MTTVDVLVAGGGPAGSMAALRATEAGLDVLLVERDAVIGSPVRCAEGVDGKGLSEFFEPDPVWISQSINGYSLIAPDGTVVNMDADGAWGYILERTRFDRMIAERAATAGARVLCGVEAAGMSAFEDGARTVMLQSGDRRWDIRARIVVAADGVESRVARWAGLGTAAKPHDMETAAQVLAAGIDIDSNRFNMYFGETYAKGGYAWVFPKGPDCANIGLGVSGDYARNYRPADLLDTFMQKHFPDAAIVGRTVGGIPCTGGIQRYTADGLMVAGDAAHMANPITGGGIVSALIAGAVAGETAGEAIRKGNATERGLKSYVKRCDDRIVKPNRRFYRLKEGIFDIPDERMNEIAHEIVALPQEKRTPVRVLRSALWNQPKLLLALAKVVF